jgi:hypothetical protein
MHMSIEREGVILLAFLITTVENSLEFTQFFILFYCFNYLFCLQHNIANAIHERHIDRHNVATHTLFTTTDQSSLKHQWGQPSSEF